VLKISTAWIKINNDGASVKNPNRASAGCIFRNHEGICLGCFARFLGEGNALFAELSTIMVAIEIADSKNYLNVWLECDSQVAIQAFISHLIVPWSLRNRRWNCKSIVQKMNFLVSQIFREGNVCIDSMANIGLSLPSLDLS